MTIWKSAKEEMQRLGINEDLIKDIVLNHNHDDMWLITSPINNFPCIKTAQKINDALSILVQWYQEGKNIFIFAIWKTNTLEVGAKLAFINFIKDYGYKFTFNGRSVDYISKTIVPNYSSFINKKYIVTYEKPEFPENAHIIDLSRKIDIKHLYGMFYAIDKDKYTANII